MSIPSELPEGITINQYFIENDELEVPMQEIDTVICEKCDIHFQSVIFMLNNKYEGIVRVVPSGHIVWRNFLPKDKDKRINMLANNLQLKLDKHAERHNND